MGVVWAVSVMAQDDDEKLDDEEESRGRGSVGSERGGEMTHRRSGVKLGARLGSMTVVLVHRARALRRKKSKQGGENG